MIATPDAVLSPPAEGLAISAPVAKYDPLRRWGGIFARFLSVQILVQAMTFASGLLIVRSLSKQEYAFYTIANAMQGTFGPLADIGVGSAVSAIGGRVWQDPVRLGEVIVTGLRVRRQLAVLAGFVVLPLAFLTLQSNGASAWSALVFCLLLLLGQYFQLLNGVLIMVPRLQGRLRVLQHQDLLVAAFRLVAVAAVVILSATAEPAVFAATLSFVFGTVLLRRCAGAGADLNRSARAEDAREMWRVVRQQAPYTIYYCFQGQITVLLLSWFGSAGLVAEVGALGRVAVLLNLIGSVMNSIVLPRFARCQDPVRLRQIYVAVVGGYALIGMSLLLLVYLIPGPFLWLLGSEYRGVSAGLFYMTLVAVSSLLTGAIYGLNAARAWTEGAWMSVPEPSRCSFLFCPL